MSWKSEFDEKFVRRFTLSEDRENTNIPNCAYSNLLGVSVDANELKDFIEALIKKEREEEHKKTWDSIKEIYDTTDYKIHVEQAEKETEKRVSHYANFLEKELEGDGYVIEAIRERYERHFKEVIR